MGTKPKEFERTILFLAGNLKNLRYAFRGTAGLVLQGIEMNVDDIDILCDQKTAEACNNLLREFVLEEVSYKESPKFKSYFGKFKINDIPIEVMGEWQIKDVKGNWSEPFNASEKEKMEVLINSQKIFVTTPETELLMFSKLGRWNAYHKIKKQLKDQRKPNNETQQQSLFSKC